MPFSLVAPLKRPSWSGHCMISFHFEHRIRTAQHKAVRIDLLKQTAQKSGRAKDDDRYCGVLQRRGAPYFQPWYMHSNISTQPLPSATGAALCRQTCRGC